MSSYNIFISWSGDRSKIAAEALRNWLPKIIQSAKPWMSETDIDMGTRGLDEIGKVLEGQNFGICCLTPENLLEPWILFEAGALSKSFDNSRLWTYLLGGLKPQEVRMPLSIFQWTLAEKEDTRKLIHAINRALNDNPIPEADLNELFEAMWPKLEEKIKALPASRDPAQPKRKVEDMVAEILEIARAEANRRRKLEQYEHVFEELMPLLEEMLRTAKMQPSPYFGVRPLTLSELAGGKTHPYPSLAHLLGGKK